MNIHTRSYDNNILLFNTIFITFIYIYHCHLHPLQAANCCHNSRLVVDEADLKRVANEKRYCYHLNNSRKMFVLKPLGVVN